MQNTATLPKPSHREALQKFAVERAKIPTLVTASEIEEYVSNLWYMDADPYRYTTD